MKKLALLIVIGFYTTCSSFSQVTPSVDSIVMRDGKKIAVDVYLPSNSGSQTYPTILIQTPYNRLLYRLQLPLGLGQNFANGKYAIVIADWRCFYGSAGACVVQPDRGKDGYDIVEWIAAQSWSSGKVGTWGPSALGKIQYQTAKENPPHLTCCVPVVAAPQFKYEEYYPGGAYRTEYVDQLDALGYGLSSFLKNNQVKNITWQYVEQANNYPDAINVPLFMIGGWFDHNTDLMIDFFNDVKVQSPIAVKDKHKMLIGPWVHGGHGIASVGTEPQGELFFPEATGWSDSLALRFFDYYLLNENNNWLQEPVVRYFGIGKNNWVSTSSFPAPYNGGPFCFIDNCSVLQIPIPIKSLNADSSAYFCEYQYDPTDPSPTIGGSTLRSDLLQGPYDQAAVEARADNISYTSMNLFECNSGEYLTILGNPLVHLVVSSDRKDTDFTVRLTDVYPNGKSIIIGEGVQRMRFRNGLFATDTSSINPGTVYEIDIKLPYISYSFLANHKIRLDVSSSNYPRYDCNLNNGGAMYVAGDSLIATNRIYSYNPASSSMSYVDFPFVDYCISGIEKSNRNYINAYILDNVLNITSTENIEKFDLSIFDSKSALVWTCKKQTILSGESKMYNLNNLPAGIYFLKYSDKSNIVKSFKLLIY
ncbi:MAG: CocE/NonD family hydrolase [Bacteroidota bacterium]